jgi:anti-sigma factor RsiW
MSMTCQKVRENLWDYHRGQVSRETAHLVRSHLETCPDCAAELQVLGQVDGALDGLAVMEPSPYFDQKLNAKLDEAERQSSVWGWAGVWLRDRYLWTFVTLFLAVMSLWLGFRHKQGEELRSMEDVVRIQDENLPSNRRSDPGATVSPQANTEAAVVPEPARRSVEGEDEAISEEDLAVVENLELLQDYDFLKELSTDKANASELRTN